MNPQLMQFLRNAMMTRMGGGGGNMWGGGRMAPGNTWAGSGMPSKDPTQTGGQGPLVSPTGDKLPSWGPGPQPNSGWGGGHTPGVTPYDPNLGMADNGANAPAYTARDGGSGGMSSSPAPISDGGSGQATSDPTGAGFLSGQPNPIPPARGATGADSSSWLDAANLHPRDPLNRNPVVAPTRNPLDRAPVVPVQDTRNPIPRSPGVPNPGQSYDPTQQFGGGTGKDLLMTGYQRDKSPWNNRSAY